MHAATLRLRALSTPITMNKIVKYLKWGCLVVVASLSCWLALSSIQVAAQSNGQPEWDSLFNLSQTGAIETPLAVVDAEGVFHVFWQDSQAGYIYTTGDDTTWTPPEALNLPFSEPPFTKPTDALFTMFYTPVLVAAPNNVIHAFWQDFNGHLHYSRAPIAEVKAGSSGWTSPQRLAESVIAQDIAVGVDGRLHLTYIRSPNTPEIPAGVYYRRSEDGGQEWSPPVLLYESSFFRSVAPGNAHVRVVAGGVTTPARTPVISPPVSSSDQADDEESDGEPAPESGGVLFPEQVHVVVTNPGVDAVFTTRSTDGGVSWHAPITVDSRWPDDSPDAKGPSGIEVALIDDNVHLSWWAGHFEVPTQCALFHQLSADAGATWQPETIVVEDRLECPRSAQFVLSHANVLFLMTAFSDRVVLQAWDDVQWSDPAEQSTLFRFVDPLTLREVRLDCRLPIATSDDRLTVIGCGSSYGKDVWMVSRPLGGIEAWSPLFRPTPVWSQPQPIADSTTQLLPPVLVQGADGRLHAFWTQSGVPVVADRLIQPMAAGGNTIYYSRMNEGGWLEARAVLMLSDGRIEQPAVAAGPDGTVLVLLNNTDGRLYYSRALDERALSLVEWMHPTVVSLTDAAIAWPHLISDETGTAYLAYALPLNEERGIYVTSSMDRGDTWADPVQVFDGVQAGWQVVGKPRLARTQEGQMHLLWRHHTLSADGRTQGLAYARSEDDGRTWSSAQSVTGANVVWSDIAVSGDRAVHRAWVEANETQTTLWHQFSTDNGLTWSAPLRVSEPDTVSGSTTMVVDSLQQPHLLQLVQRSNNQLFLQEWVWQGERWLAGESLDLGQVPIEVGAIEAIVDSNGRLTVLYLSLFKESETGALIDGLL